MEWWDRGGGGLTGRESEKGTSKLKRGDSQTDKPDYGRERCGKPDKELRGETTRRAGKDGRKKKKKKKKEGQRKRQNPRAERSRKQIERPP